MLWGRQGRQPGEDIVSAVDCTYVARRNRSTGAAPWRGLLALGLGLCLTACGSDTSEPKDGPPVRLEVGTGLGFTAITPDSTLELIRGCQGSQHVFISLRAWDLPTSRNTVQLLLERASDGVDVSAPYDVQLRFDAPASDGEPALLEGLLLIVPDAAAAVDREVRLSAAIETEDGQRATDARIANLQWGPPTCP